MRFNEVHTLKRERRMKPIAQKYQRKDFPKFEEAAYKTPPADVSGVKPGTRAFGQRAAARLERLKQEERRGDLRVRTAGRTVWESTRAKNKYLAGD